MLQLEIAGTVIQLEDNEGALVVYTDCQYKGKWITIYYYGGSGSFKIEDTGSFVERPTASGTVCAAIFPRISTDYYSHYKDYYFKSDFFAVPPGSIKVTAGNITEVYVDKKQ